VTDRIAGKEVSVQYCPTGDMASDFFTKPLQGALFRKLRSIIMNNDQHGNDHEDHRSVLGGATEQSTAEGPRESGYPRAGTKGSQNNSKEVDSGLLATQ
jgi:hypothetical protein